MSLSRQKDAGKTQMHLLCRPQGTLHNRHPNIACGRNTHTHAQLLAYQQHHHTELKPPHTAVGLPCDLLLLLQCSQSAAYAVHDLARTVPLWHTALKTPHRSAPCLPSTAGTHTPLPSMWHLLMLAGQAPTCGHNRAWGGGGQQIRRVSNVSVCQAWVTTCSCWLGRHQPAGQTGTGGVGGVQKTVRVKTTTTRGWCTLALACKVNSRNHT